jgi:hypothetical protein
LDYSCQLGNNLFQYAFARILAEKSGRAFLSKPLEHFSETEKHLNGYAYLSGKPLVLKGSKVDFNSLLSYNGPIFIVNKFYGQRYEYYKESKDKIRRWLTQSLRRLANPKTDKKDIALHIRCFHTQDRLTAQTMDTSYYEECINRISDINKGYKNIHIFTDNTNDKNVVMPILKKYKCKIMNIKSPATSMSFISSYKNIIMSQSTFSWWSSFLSEAENICFPRPDSGFWSRGNQWQIQLEVDDEERYIYVDGKTLK